MWTRLVVFFLVIVAQVGAGADVSWVKRFSLSKFSDEWNASGQYTIGPDSQTLVYRRDERPGRTREPHWRGEVVYLDLATCEERAVISLRYPVDTVLAISADASTVAIYHQVDSPRQPPVISIWRPLGGALDLRDYDKAETYELRQSRDGTEFLEGTFFAEPAFSPDGTRLAFSGQRMRSAPSGDSLSAEDAVGVLDLREGRTIAIPLPMVTDTSMDHQWNLAWGRDSSVIWVTAHGAYESGVLEAETAGKTTVYVARPQLPPNWMLYRCTLADRKATAVANVPPSILGIDADGDIIVSDVDRAKERSGPSCWHRTGFGQISLGELETRTQGKPEAALALALEAKTTTILPEGGGDFQLEKVFVGSKHTYAVGWLRQEHVVLERVPVAPQRQ